MIERARNFIGLAGAYLRFNLKAECEYAASFQSQVVAMIINDCCWLTFWIMFFNRFPVLEKWTINDVITLWALVAAGFGLGLAVFGNALSLPRIICRGGLDSWLLYPRAVLWHLLLGKTHVTAWGDIIFGTVSYLVLIRPDQQHALMFLVLLFAIAAVMIASGIIAGSAAFFVGSAEILAEQWLFSLLTFSTYPPHLFKGPIKTVLYTVIPAGFVGYLPAEALKACDWNKALLCCLAALIMLAIANAVFYVGLRRYESGNLSEMRG